MTKFYNHSTMIAAPFSVTSVLTNLATATEAYLSVRGAKPKLAAWRILELRLAEAQELLKVCI